MNETGFRRPPTAQEAVLAELRRAIVSGQLKPGEQVLQDALAEQFGVSRVPLREALKILEGEGQVVYRPHRGYFVAELDVADLREVYLMRDLLESEAVRLAVPRLTAGDLRALTAAATDVDEADVLGDLVAMTAANRRFHFILIEAAGMPRLARLVRILWDATDAYRSLYYAEPDHRAWVQEEHHAVVDAVTAGDAERAVAILREHREHAVQAVARVLGG
ncbi:MAG: GntR family transcriptional regulator [Actinomycetota bacterium]|nr:GntR family transcriptional regulator [Actinomycetota bacterium]MDH4353674.1 GntR family transcriptional regulator [Actinomycetota bacterium]MDH5278727.1 GntR family transcriptional regulator [Actinomycetota bacterium]